MPAIAICAPQAEALMRHGSGFVDSCRTGCELAFARGEDDEVARDDAGVL